MGTFFGPDSTHIREILLYHGSVTVYYLPTNDLQDPLYYERINQHFHIFVYTHQPNDQTDL